MTLPLRLNETQISVFGRMGETPMGEGGRLMTALAEGELAQRFPHGKGVHSAKNKFFLLYEAASSKEAALFVIADVHNKPSATLAETRMKPQPMPDNI